MWFSSKKKPSPFSRVFFPVALLLLPLVASEAREGDSPSVINLYETGRKLQILPFRNLTGDDSLDYLSTGLPGMMTGQIRKVPFVWESRPRRVFQANPGGYGDSKDDSSGGEGDRLPLDVSYDKSVIDQGEEGENNTSLARRLGADYLVRGSYRILDRKLRNDFYRNDTIEVSLIFYNGINGRSTSFTAKYGLEEIYREAESLTGKIAALLTSGKTVFVFVETERPGAMAYLDEIYLGRTPVRSQVVPGEYTLVVEEENHRVYSRPVKIDPEKKETRLYADPVPLELKAGLRVTSEPAGADVYLDVKKIGTTPLDLADLPTGTHRVRVSMDGYVDRFVGVELVSGGTRSLDLLLEEGDTEETFTREGYQVMDWTNHDLAFYSLLSSLFFYGGYWYWDVRADRASESVYPLVLSMSLLDYPQGSLYYNSIIEKKRHETDRLRRNSSISGGLGVLAVLAGGTLLWRDILYDNNDIGEVQLYGAILPEARDGSSFYSMGMTYRF